jgi:cell division protein FtsN
VRVPHVLLAVATFAVLGLGVYLFIEVRNAPAAPHVEASAPAHVTPPADETPAPTTPTAPVVAKRDRHDPIPVEPETPPPRTPEELQKADPNNDSLMDEANKAYDKQEFEEARAIANRILAKDPTNVRMLRILVSAACVEVDQAEAAKWLAKLPPNDQNAMKTRCTRYGITFADSKK